MSPTFSDTELDCKQCDTVLQELENIDDDAEAAGKVLAYILVILFNI